MLIATQGFRTCIRVSAMWGSCCSSKKIGITEVVGLEVVTVGSDVEGDGGPGGRGVDVEGGNVCGVMVVDV